MAEYSSNSPGNGASVHTPSVNHDVWNFVTVLNIPSNSDRDDIRKSLKASIGAEEEELVSRAQVVQTSSMHEKRRYATATVKTKKLVNVSSDIEISVGMKSKSLCLFSEECHAVFNISCPIFTDTVCKNIQLQANQFNVSIIDITALGHFVRLEVRGSCHQVNKFRECLSQQCLDTLLQHSEVINRSSSGEVSAAGVVESNVSTNSIPESNNTSSLGNAFTNLSSDVLLIMRSISGLKYYPDEGRVEVLVTDQEEKDKVISLFQEAYQSVIQNSQFKTDTLELPKSTQQEEVVRLLSDFNNRYQQCRFVYYSTSHSVKMIGLSSRQFDQAQKLLKRRLVEGKSGSTFVHEKKGTCCVALPNDRVVTLKQGNMTKESADVIVNAANRHLKHVGGLAKALNQASNGKLQEHSDTYTRKYGDLATGKVAVTKAGGNLQCKHVIHAVGPSANECSSVEECQQLIHDAVTNSLQQASRLNAISIVLPALSTGIFAIDPAVSAKAMFNAIASFACRKECVKDVRIVILDAPIYTEFAKQLTQWKAIIDEGRAHKLERSLSDQGPEMSLHAENFSDVVTSQPSPSSIDSANTSSPSVHAVFSTPSGVSVPPPGFNDGPPTSNYASDEHVAPTTTIATGFLKSPTLVITSSKATPTHNTVECPICLNDVNNGVEVQCCKQHFCKHCIDEALKVSSFCPMCKAVLRPVKGNQPNGKMTHHLVHQHLPGFSGCKTIVIRYNFPGGVQLPEHPNPGQNYSGTTREAYLPDNDEGRHVLALLKKAFDAGVTFTIGRSVTTGKDNTVVWNDIHHKTNMYGGSNNFGYPDSTYLKRVQDELKAKGIF